MIQRPNKPSPTHRAEPSAREGGEIVRPRGFFVAGGSELFGLLEVVV